MATVTLPVAAAAPPPAFVAPSPAHVTYLLLGLGFATGMEFYTVDSVNLVLTDLTGTLGVSADQASWLLTTYSSTLFLGVPISTWLAGHVGHKRYLIASILLFAVASMGCGLSADFGTMLVLRAIQGAAGAGLVVWWRASIYLLLPKPQRSPSLMRVSTMLYLSSAAGLLASGWLTDHASWRLIFVPNLLFAAAAICLLLRYFPTLPAQAATHRAPPDWPGIALIAVALVSLQVILSRGHIDDWFGSPRIRLLAWISAAGLVLFVLWQSSPRNPAPLLRLELLRDRNVMSSALIGVLTGIILSGSLYVLPLFLRNIADQTLSATHTGRVMCVYALTAAAIRPLMVGLIPRIGQRKTICAALVALIASMLLFERLLTAGTPVVLFLAPLVLYAFCLSPLLPAVGSGTVARVEPDKLFDGVSLYMTFRQFGASLGVGLLAILLERRETLHSARLVEHLYNGSQALQGWRATAATTLGARGGYSAWEAQHRTVKLLAESVARQAATLAYADAFLFMAAVGVVALCLVPIIPPTPVVPKR